MLSFNILQNRNDLEIDKSHPFVKTTWICSHFARHQTTRSFAAVRTSRAVLPAVKAHSKPDRSPPGSARLHSSRREIPQPRVSPLARKLGDRRRGVFHHLPHFHYF